MPFTINTGTVGNMFNAEVLNMNDVSDLAPKDRDALFIKLVEHLDAQARLIAASAQLGDDAANRLTRETTNLKASLTQTSGTEDKKKKIVDYIAFLKTSLGGAAEIVLSAVKLAHL